MNHQSIIIGIISAIITYAYMKWTKDRQEKLNKKISQKPINISIPLGVGVIGWFVSDSYFSKLPSQTCGMKPNLPVQNSCLIQPPALESKSIGSCSFQLIDIKPSTISNQFMQSAVPDVFLNEDLL
jgi:hypothetical protein